MIIDLSKLGSNWEDSVSGGMWEPGLVENVYLKKLELHATDNYLEYTFAKVDNPGDEQTIRAYLPKDPKNPKDPKEVEKWSKALKIKTDQLFSVLTCVADRRTWPHHQNGQLFGQLDHMVMLQDIVGFVNQLTNPSLSFTLKLVGNTYVKDGQTKGGPTISYPPVCAPSSTNPMLSQWTFQGKLDFSSAEAKDNEDYAKWRANRSAEQTAPATQSYQRAPQPAPAPRSAAPAQAPTYVAYEPVPNVPAQAPAAPAQPAAGGLNYDPDDI